MPYGNITRIEHSHGYGFIADDGGMDWFFVAAGARGGLDALWIDERVAFSSEDSAGGPRAVDVHNEQLD